MRKELWIDAAEAVASVLLATVAAQWAGVAHVGWAAFSAFMVIRPNFAVSLQRARLRILGTLAGAFAGALMAVHFAGPGFVAGLLLGTLVFVTMYLTLLWRHPYAWLFTGLTFLMVFVEGLSVHKVTPATFAISRIEEVLIGTLASLLIGYVASRTWRSASPCGSPCLNTPGLSWHARGAWHSVETGFTVFWLAILPYWISGPLLIQAGVTVIAAMSVPLPALDDGRLVVFIRLLHRVLGCAMGALLAAGILLVSQHNPAWITLGLCFGVAIGRYVENGPHTFGYVGVQFALAFLVVLVPDRYALADTVPAEHRFLGILLGFGLLALTEVLFGGARMALGAINRRRSLARH
ncbi:FUSC family protein [Dyella japonica]|uniref:FUSC family protein n=1 Tax=Dyella japonica TaxID=231455 RepID=UPI00037A2044|nr:FUSC family protein [Dyella japonica]